MTAPQTSKHRQRDQQIGVYECEVKLKFRLIEENLTDCDRENLLHMLVDAFAYGSDEYLESLQTEISVEELEEIKASPQMRRQLMRLRNAMA
jgi:hypothetical protein